MTWSMIEVRDSPKWIFGSWAWYSQGLIKYKEFLGNRRRRRRRRRRRQLVQNGPNMSKSDISWKWTRPKIPGYVIFQKQKPLRERTTEGHLFRTYPKRINSFLKRSQKWEYPHFRYFGSAFPRLCQFWSKTKMVRMVHRNNFCGMGLEIRSPKSELWTKTEILEGWEIPKFSFEAQGGVLRVSTRPKMILKISWTIPNPF